MGRPDTWTEQEIDLLRRNILPEGKKLGTARMKAHRLGIRFTPVQPKHGIPWSKQDDDELLSGRIPAGRSEMSCRVRAKALGITYSRHPNGGAEWARWTDAEIEQLKKGYIPEGRTLGAARAFAFQHRIAFNLADSRRKSWTAEEDALIAKGEVPPNRTSSACRARASKLGIVFDPRANIPNPKWKRDGRAEAMWVLHNGGFTYIRIGGLFRITRERVRQLVNLYDHWHSKYGDMQ